mmetsp:Transcript_85589/g.151549  ORF Transcript_85589/g.151549 Transcript_85589/m.151549 type:complete len:591 (+) Transcript_85589:119-1891(+)|eukprot:CAMPEP_0197657734 /NCGR_PEP_ID=MMETSP1338-20131121/44807_1 /TAXON_ID=43686 ORGANISM="Pelagodinium beii, Strain RCC1491" /NCGR_SAMPLE_ID=MMETSP1338 /ASSEMBLY_ACC=CAM_ASM_000754 /LENGTH=590 /DNA_ID=CAMNT_0043234173 /DNA_START=38 /DNA_END=1810 /DNA_ORIENTATION=+
MTSRGSLAAIADEEKPGSRQRMQSAVVKVGALQGFEKSGARASQKVIEEEEEEKAKKEAAKKKAAGIDPVQFGSIGVSIVGLLWMIASTVLSGMFTIRYLGIVEEDQSWYLLNGAAAFAREEATRVLRTAGDARDAFAASIEFGHIATSSDYASIERSIAPPLVFNPFLKSLEIAFSDREAGLRITHVRAGDAGQKALVLQSNAADCFLLGPQGCADFGVDPGEFPAYYDSASFLKMEELSGMNESAQGPSRSKLIAWSKEAPAAEGWEVASLTVGEVEGEGLNDPAALFWYPTLRLLFRQPLPEAWSEERHTVVGRVTLEVGELTGQRLYDERLGPNGRSFLVDRRGTVLASVDVKDTLRVVAGSITFRTLKEVQDAPWASLLDSAFKDEGKMDPLQVQGEDGYAAAFLPLNSPLDDFAVVVACPMDGTTFKDDVTFGSMLILSGFASFPYAITLLLIFGACCSSQEDPAMAAATSKKKEPAGVRMLNRATGIVTRATQRVSMRVAQRASVSSGGLPGIGNRRGSISSMRKSELMSGVTDEDFGTEADQYGTKRLTYIQQDIKFEMDDSYKGAAARFLRNYLGKGRQEA